ncbi:hypothetical protein DES36_11963 [Alkalibaculum bacchi]|uniref:RDD family protein n=1 Tax=Alkalibaculum bacchi TaxID=645887 RepID=A0A366I1L2_9FIRM|nr:DUF5592 family protein [Alkalibaculum bacchi]RBP59338.1 hypothetical protein DES36_11963 [Alkalibaculum bacchi]
MYKNPKNTRQEIKLWAFYLLDIAIVAGMLLIANNISKIIPLSPSMQIFYYIFSACFGVFLCMKTTSHPIDRNLNILFYIFRMDRNKYHSID